MPRTHRLDVANGVHHVTQRGVDRRNIVLDDDDRSHWWRLFERRVPLSSIMSNK